MAHIPLVGIYDRSLARRALYASHLTTRLPLEVMLIGSVAEMQEGQGKLAALIASFDDDEERARVLAYIPRCGVEKVVVIDSRPYEAQEYAEIALQGHFVRSASRVPHIFDTITSILKP